MTNNWLTLHEEAGKYSLSERDLLLLMKDQNITVRISSKKDQQILLLVREIDLLEIAFMKKENETQFKDMMKKATVGILGDVSAHIVIELFFETSFLMARDIEALWCPELVVIPSGELVMGAMLSGGRFAHYYDSHAMPRHRVAIAAPFAIGKYQVTRGQFARFIEATGHDTSGGAWIFTGKGGQRGASADWCSPGFEQTDQHPVVCVSWDDAKAYLAWLSEETGQPYRLLSEAEWEYAARAGTTTRYWWGDDPPTPEQANFDRNVDKTTEVGAHPPNPWGLHDMHGNVWEWVEDCWNKSYEGAPTDGSAWTSGDCSRRVLRGGSWFNFPGFLRSAIRVGGSSGDRLNVGGFRVARTLSRSAS